jgi:hypothetical protein
MRKTFAFRYLLKATTFFTSQLEGRPSLDFTGLFVRFGHGCSIQFHDPRKPQCLQQAPNASLVFTCQSVLFGRKGSIACFVHMLSRFHEDFIDLCGLLDQQPLPNDEANQPNGIQRSDSKNRAQE